MATFAFAAAVSAAPPTLGDITDRTVLVDQPTDAILLALADSDTPVLNLVLTGSSSNPTLVPTENIFFGIAGGDWYLTVTPAFGLTGTATITITVSDGTDSVSDTFLLTVNAPPAGTSRFANPSPITIPDSGAAAPYPSSIGVSGMSGVITKLVLTMSKFSHERIPEVDMLLVGPNGQGAVIFSGISGGNRSATNVTVNLTDSSTFPLPGDFALWSEPLRPADYRAGDSFPGAPAGPYGAPAFSSFHGLTPNGTWSLYVYDAQSLHQGDIAGGWSLLISTVPGADCPAIVQQPASTLTRSGSSVGLSVTATGEEPFAYQWRKDGTPLAGQTGSTLSFSSVSLTDNGVYSVSVSNDCDLILSSDATLTVLPIVPWGDNGLGQASLTTMPLSVSNAVLLAAGGGHNVAVKADGTVVAWGNNADGQSTVPGGLINVVAVAAGYDHSIALKSDGTLVAWGRNATGEGAVPGGLSDVVAISANERHNIALKKDGTVVGWGLNEGGQSSVPLGGRLGAIALSAGALHNLALRHDGTVVAWGANGAGQTTVPPGLADVVAVAAGGDFSLALKNDGTVVAWGGNDFGQATVPPGLADVVAIAAGSQHAVAQKADGTIVAWGKSDLHQAEPPPGLVGVRGITAGFAHCLALVDSLPIAPFISQQPAGQIARAGTTVSFAVKAVGFAPLTYQWRKNGVALPGQTAPRLTGIPVSDRATYSVVVSNAFGLVASSDATPLALPIAPWGDETLGQGTFALVPISASNAVAVAAGGGHSAAIRADGTAIAWSFNASGQSTVPPEATDGLALASGYDHNLLLRSNGTVVAWGRNLEGQTDVPVDLSDAIAVSANEHHSLALKADHTVLAWGHDDFGQASVPPGVSDVTAIAAGVSHNLVLKSDGTVFGWGRNDSGQVTIPPGLSDVLEIAAGGDFSLALKSDGTVVAWGANGSGQTTVPEGLANVVAIAAGYGHALALKADGTVVAWGLDSAGQATVPAGLSGVRAIAAGFGHSLALLQGDATPPVITTCAPNRSLAANASCQAVLPNLTTEIVATDNIDTSLTITQSPVAGTLLGLGDHAVLLTVTDDGGNSASCTATVTVTDTTPPVVTLVGPSSIEVKYAHPFVDPGATALDACAGDVSVVITGDLNVNALGTYTLTYSATDDFSNVGSTTRTVTVVPDDPIITWTTPAGIIYGTALGGAQLNASANVSGSFVYAPPAGTVLHAGDGQVLFVHFTPADSVNYHTADASVTIDVARAPLGITAVNSSKVYGAALPSFTATYSGFVNADNAASLDSAVNLTTTATDQSPVGDYTISAAGAVDVDYVITHHNGTLSITHATLTVNGITASTKPYDGNLIATLNTTSAALVGVLPGDSVTFDVSAATGAFASSTVGPGKLVAITGVTIGGPSAANYTLLQPTTTADITPRGLTVSGITAANKAYDRTTAASLNTSAAALVGALAGDAVTLNTGAAAGAFADKTVGTGKTVTVSGLTIEGTDAGNYALAQPTTTADITPRTLTVSGITGINKIYDGTASAGLNTAGAGLVGVVSGDTVTLNRALAVGVFADKAVGTGKPVAVTGLTLDGSDAGNYTLTQPTTTANITARSLTVTGISGVNKVYDSTTAAALNTAGVVLVGAVAGDAVTLNTASAVGAFADKAVGTTKPVTVTGLTLDGTDAGNYTLTQPATTANITPRALTVAGITAADKAYDGTTTATLTTTGAMLLGVVPDDAVTLNASAAAGAFADPAVGTGKLVTISGLTIGGGDVGNYTLTQPTTTANITAHGLTVTGVTANNKTYDGNTSATLNTAGATLVGIVPGGTVNLNSSGAVGVFANKNAGTGKTVTVSGLTIEGTDAGNYTLTQPTTTADITARALTASGITAPNRVYDGTTIAALDTSGAALVGVLAGETVSLNSTLAAGAFADKAAATGKPVTVTGLTLDGGGAGNYTLTQPTTTASITPRALTVAGITAANKAYDGTTTAVLNTTGAALVGRLAGDIVTMNTAGAAGTFADPEVGSGKTVTIAGLTISGADAGNYSLVQPTTTADIVSHGLTVTGITAANKVYDRTTTAALNTSAAALVGVMPGDTVTINVSAATGAFASKTVGTGKPVTISGVTIGGPNAANYTLIQPTGTADITPRGLTVSGITAANRVYDRTTTASLNTSLAALVGVLVGDTATLNTGDAAGAFADKTVGTGKTVTVSGLSIGGDDAGNYALTQPTTTADITAVGLTVAGITGVNKVYDGTASAGLNTALAVLVGVVPGDTVTLNTASAMGAFADKAVGTGRPVAVTGLTIGGGDAGNYTLVQPGTTADITARGLTVSGITAANKAYDGTTTAVLNTTGAAPVGRLAGDIVTLNTAGATGTFADPDVGTGKTVTIAGLTIGGADAGNYSVVQPTTTADIVSNGLTVTGITAANKGYDATTTAALNTSGAVLVGVALGDTVTLNVSAAAGAFANKNVGTGKPVTISGVTIGGPNAANYTLIQPTATADITARGLTVSGITAASKVYDGTTTAVLATSGAALVGLVSGDTVNLNSGAVAGAFANKNVGSGKTVTVSGLTIDGVDAGNYSLAQPTTTADITKATLIATADDKTRVSGVSNPTFTVHYTGFVNGEGAGELDAPPTASTTADVNSPIGTYAIVLSGGHDNNYELTLVNGTLSVVAETLVLRIERVPATPGFVKVRVLAVGVPGRTYHLEASPVLPAGIWAEIASFKALADGSIAFIDNNAPIQPARFYRIRVP